MFKITTHEWLKSHGTFQSRLGLCKNTDGYESTKKNYVFSASENRRVKKTGHEQWEETKNKQIK